jgi:hypothetical protein
MKKLFEFTIRITADNLEEAMATLRTSSLDHLDWSFEGERFIHPDGQTLPYDVPPPGTKVVIAFVVNLEGAFSYFAAIPEDSELIRYPGFSDELPKGSYFWKEKEERWQLA